MGVSRGANRTPTFLWASSYTRTAASFRQASTGAGGPTSGSCQLALVVWRAARGQCPWSCSSGHQWGIWNHSNPLTTFSSWSVQTCEVGSGGCFCRCLITHLCTTSPASSGTTRRRTGALLAAPRGMLLMEFWGVHATTPPTLQLSGWVPNI